MAAVIDGEAWVIEWLYPATRPRIAARAQVLAWLDLPRRVVMWRVVARTVRRRLTRQVLWNGNVEPPLRTLFTDPDHIVRWAWRTHGRGPSQVAEAVAANPGLAVVRLRSRREVGAWLATLTQHPRPGPGGASGPRRP